MSVRSGKRTELNSWRGNDNKPNTCQALSGRQFYSPHFSMRFWAIRCALIDPCQSLAPKISTNDSNCAEIYCDFLIDFFLAKWDFEQIQSNLNWNIDQWLHANCSPLEFNWNCSVSISGEFLALIDSKLINSTVRFEIGTVSDEDQFVAPLQVLDEHQIRKWCFGSVDSGSVSKTDLFRCQFASVPGISPSQPPFPKRIDRKHRNRINPSLYAMPARPFRIAVRFVTVFRCSSHARAHKEKRKKSVSSKLNWHLNAEV